MKETNKIPYIPLIGGLLILLIGYFIVGIIGGVVGGVIAGIIIYAVMSKTNEAGESTKQTTDAETCKPKSVDNLDISLESLVKTNLMLRKNIVLPNVRDEYEGVIDALVDVLPKVHEAIPDGELYWVVNRIATEYLPNKSVAPYLALTPEEQQSEDNVTKVMDSIKAIMAELSEISQLLSTKNSNEFSIKAKFIQHRFNI